jgi:ATP-binding cassette subfamily B protein
MGPATIDHFEQPAFRDLLMTAEGRGNFSNPVGGFVHGAADQWPRRLAGAGAVILVARFNVLLALALPTVAIAGLQAWRRSFYSVALGPGNNVEGVRAASYTLGLGTGGHPSREVRVFGLVPWLLARHRELWLESMRPLWRHRAGSSWLVAASIVANASMRLLGLSLLARAALRGELEAETAAVVAPSIIASSQITWISGGSETAMQRCLSAAGAVLTLQRTNRQRTAPEPASTGRSQVTDVPPQIRFEDVSFTYPSGTGVFDRFSLEIEPGTSTAIVGLNGAGKDDARQAPRGSPSPDRGARHGRRSRPPRCRSGRMASAAGGDLPGLRALFAHGAGEHRLGVRRPSRR